MLMHTKLLATILINLFYCYKKVFTYMNTWMIGKKSMKHHYQKKKDLYSHSNMEDITYADYAHAKKVCKVFKRKK